MGNLFSTLYQLALYADTSGGTKVLKANIDRISLSVDDRLEDIEPHSPTVPANPTINDDDTQGYSVGQPWMGLADTYWICTDNSTGAANWVNVTAIGSGDMIAANNLSDVADQQTALNNLTAVSGATAGHVLTKVGTDAVFQAVAGGGDMTKTVYDPDTLNKRILTANIDGTKSPGTDNDGVDTDGYGRKFVVGDLWIYTLPSPNKIYICISNGSNTAEWREILDSATVQTITGVKTFEDSTLLLRNVGDTFDGKFTNANTANRTYTLPDLDGVVALKEGAGGSIASATAMTIPVGDDYFGVNLDVTPITSMVVDIHREFTLVFAAGITLTHNASDLNLPNDGNDIITQGGDSAKFQALAANQVYCTNYTRADGTALVGNSNGHVIKDATTTFTQRADLKFLGSGVEVADTGGQTVVTISGALAAPAFTSIVASGTGSVPGYDVGDTLILNFDMATNSTSSNITAATHTGTTMNTWFSLSTGTFGATDTFNVTWPTTSQCVIEVATVVTANIPIGDTLTLLVAADLKNSAESSAASVSDGVITGDWGVATAVYASKTLAVDTDGWATYLKGDELSGPITDTISGLSGSQTQSTANASGIIDGCRSFSGSNTDIIDLPPLLPLNFLSGGDAKMVCSFWVYVPTTFAAGLIFNSQLTNSTSAVLIGITASGQVHVLMGEPGLTASDISQIQTTTNPLIINNWNHVFISFRGANTASEGIWINGNTSNATQLSFGPQILPSIGTFPDYYFSDLSSPFTGRVDEFCLAPGKLVGDLTGGIDHTDFFNAGAGRILYP